MRCCMKPAIVDMQIDGEGRQVKTSRGVITSNIRIIYVIMTENKGILLYNNMPI